MDGGERGERCREWGRRAYACARRRTPRVIRDFERSGIFVDPGGAEV